MENINDNLTQMYLSCLALIVTEHEESIKRIHSFSRQRFLLINNMKEKKTSEDSILNFYKQQTKCKVILILLLKILFTKVNTSVIG